MSVKIHALQTGSVKIKTAQRSRKPGGLLRILSDSAWTEWLPILTWVVEHPEGIIIVDTGETAQTASRDYFPKWHPYFAGSLMTRVSEAEEIGPQLTNMGIEKKAIKCIIMTHLHTDHAGGLAHFPDNKILLSHREYALASGLSGRILGYLPQRWPEWFAPVRLTFETKSFGPFKESFNVTKSGDVVIVPTPGHSPGHVSVVVKGEDCSYFLAGDTSYSQALLKDKKADGVSLRPVVTIETMENILRLAKLSPMVYLPSHDPDSIRRLRNNQTLFHSESAPAATEA